MNPESLLYTLAGVLTAQGKGEVAVVATSRAQGGPLVRLVQARPGSDSPCSVIAIGSGDTWLGSFAECRADYFASFALFGRSGGPESVEELEVLAAAQGRCG